jgi:hypothetical protein
VLKETLKEADRAVHFAHELVAEAVADGERAEGADGVGEEGVGSVEGVDVAGAGGELRPARGLDGAGGLEGEDVEVLFPLVVGDEFFAHEAEEIAVGADVVEAVVVDADVGDVGRHEVDGVAAADVEEGFVAGDFELVERAAELEALGPFGPAARGVFALDGEDGRAPGGVPPFLEAKNLFAGEFEELVNRRLEGGGREGVVDLDHGKKRVVGNWREMEFRGNKGRSQIEFGNEELVAKFMEVRGSKAVGGGSRRRC